MARDSVARNSLKQLLANPSSYAESPDFIFARDQALEAAGRRNSVTRGSGNAIAEAAKLAAGYASQGYGQRVGQLAQIAGQDDQFDIASDQNAIARDRLSGDMELGRGRLGLEGELGRGRLGLDSELGRGRLDLERQGQSDARDQFRQRIGLDTELGRGRLGLEAELGRGNLALGGRAADTADRRVGYDYSLGTRAANTADKRAEYDYTLGAQRADTDRFQARTSRDLGFRSADTADRRTANDFDIAGRGIDTTRTNNHLNYILGADRNRTDRYNARTSRRSADSRDYFGEQENARSWIGTAGRFI